MARVGSFAAPVDLPERLRPWRAAGLEVLLAPDGLQSQPLAGQIDPGAPAAPTSTEAQPASAGLAWPEPWAALAARVRTPPQIIITYASLTADLSGRPDPARRKLFQSILAYLAWPPGTSLFWPCVDAPGTPPQARNIFLNGVLHFGVAHVACFGIEAAKLVTALFPDEGPRPEVSVHALPDPDALLALLPHELHRAVATLKALDLA